VKSWIVTVMVLVALAAPLAAEKSPFNVDFIFGWDGCYRPLEWTPIEIGIAANLKKPFGGVVTVSADQDGLTRMKVHRQFVLTPDLPVRLPLVSKLAHFADGCQVALRDEKGRVVWENEFSLWNLNTTSVGNQDILIGFCGVRSPSLIRLEKNCVHRALGQPGRVYVKDKLPRALPWDWTGYASLDALVLYDMDWDLINPHQAKAISQWVSNGGTLVMVLGARSLSLKHPLAELLPVVCGDPTERDLSAPLHEKHRPAEPVKVVGRTLAPRTDGLARCVRGGLGTDAALWATGLVGFGKVAVLGFDPTSMEVPEEDRVRFWIARTKELLRGRLSRGNDSSGRTSGMVMSGGMPPAMPGMPGLPGMPTLQPADSGDGPALEYVEDASSQTGQYGHMDAGAQVRASNQVLEDLLTIPELRPLNIGWVIGLLVLLALLLGPVDYLVLRKLGKLPLTWVTSSVLIAVFTVGAYYGVRALRSGDARLRVRSLVDIVQGQPAWRTTYAGIFAPVSDEYRLDGLGEAQWWSGISPAQEAFWRYQSQGLLRTLDCFQVDGVNLPAALPINIWSMQCLLCEQPDEDPPLTATAQRDGDSLVVRVRNGSDRQIVHGWVITRQGYQRLPNIPAGQEKVVRAESDKAGRHGGWSPIANGHGAARRTAGAEAYLSAGGVVVWANFDEAPPPVTVHGRDARTDHEFAVRFVIPPEEVLP
jgi:hypothetical protein